MNICTYLISLRVEWVITFKQDLILNPYVKVSLSMLLSLESNNWQQEMYTFFNKGIFNIRLTCNTKIRTFIIIEVYIKYYDLLKLLWFYNNLRPTIVSESLLFRTLFPFCLIDLRFFICLIFSFWCITIEFSVSSKNNSTVFRLYYQISTCHKNLWTPWCSDSF
jgi:hypothetical protein